MPLAFEEIVRFEEEKMFDVWDMAGRPVGGIVQIGNEKKASGAWDMRDCLDRAKADHLSAIPGVWEC